MKKNLSGMTLVEIIIAFAIFTIMALLLASVMAISGRSRIDTAGLNRRIDQQAGIADVRGRFTPKTTASDPNVQTPAPVLISINGVNFTANCFEVNANKDGVGGKDADEDLGIKILVK